MPINDIYTDLSIVDKYNVEDINAIPSTSKVPWSESAAKEYATKVSIASGVGADEETITKITTELLEAGKSPTANELISGKKKERIVSEIGTASDMVASGELDPETGAVAAVTSLNKDEDPDQVVHEEAINNIADPSTVDIDKFLATTERERAILSENSGQLVELLENSNSTVGNVIDFFASALPFLENRALANVVDMLKEKYNADLETPAFSFIAGGSMKESVREWMYSLPAEEKVEVARAISETAKQYSGIFTPNEFIRLNILDDILSTETGATDIEDATTFKLVDNAVSILDLTAVAGLAKNALKGTKNLVEISRTSNAATLERTNPEAGATLAADIIRDTTEEVAQNAGVTRADTVAQNILVKMNKNPDHPNVAASAVFEKLEEAQELLDRGSELRYHLSQTEKAKQAQSLLDEVSNISKTHVWENTAFRNITDDGVEVGVQLGRTKKRGFLDIELDDAIDTIKKRHPNAEIEVVRRNYDNTVERGAKATEKVDSVDIPKRVQESAKQALVKTSKELSTTDKKGLKRLNKLVDKKVLEEGILRAIKNPEEATDEALEAADAAIRAVADKKGITLQEARQEALRLATRRLKDTTREINKLNNNTAIRNYKEAYENLRRAIAGDFRNLKGDLSKEYYKLYKASQPSDFFIEVKIKKPFEVDDNVVFDLDQIYMSGPMASLLADISSALGTQYSNSFYRVFDMSRRTERLMLSIMEPFFKASTKAKMKAAELLQVGAREEVVYTIDDILDQIPSDFTQRQIQETIDAYYSARMMADTTYEVLNKSYRNHLETEGFVNHVSVEGFDTVAKPITSIEQSSVKTVFDPKTKHVIPVEDVEGKLKEGAQIFRSKFLLGKGTDKTMYLLVDDAATVSELPSRVLKYREGYLPRTYKDQYFITVKPKKARINGEELPPRNIPEETILVAKSRKEAKSIVEAMAREDADNVYDFHNAREDIGPRRLAKELDIELNTGGLFFGKRGDHLKNQAGELAEVEDPIASVLRMAGKAARTVELDPVIDLMKKRFVNTFKDKLGNIYPTSKEVIKAAKNKLTDEELDKAMAMWDYIDHIESVDLTTGKWRANAIRFGEWLEDKGFDRLGSVFRTTVAENSPIQKLRQATFLTTIVLNPIRQLFIQSQQILFLSGVMPKYVLSGKIHKEALPLLVSSLDNNPVSIKALADVAGMTPKEFKDMAKAFRDSGLVEATDSHIVGRDAVKRLQRLVAANTNLGKGAGKVQEGVGKVLDAIKTVGFDAGERTNIAYTFTLARKRYLENTGKVASDLTGEDWFKIASDARQLALGMTQPGSFKYQKGWASLAMQFFSVQHKALLVMMRGVPGLSHYGNKAISVAEARRIALFQTLLFGASGTGVTALVDKMLEETGVQIEDEDAKHMLYGGLYDLTANAILRIATGDKVDLNFAKSVSAGDGFYDNITDMIGEVIGGEGNLVSLFMGPSSTFASRVGDAMRTTSLVALDAVTGVDKELSDVPVAMDKALRIMSGYNNYLKYRAMVNKGAWADKNLEALPAEASKTEAAIAGALGITGYKQEAAYDFLIDSSSVRKSLQEIADKYYADTVFKLNRYVDGQDFRTLRALHLAMNDTKRTIVNALGKTEAEQVMKLVRQKIKRNLNKFGKDDLVQSMARVAMSGSTGASAEDIIRAAGNKASLSEEDINKLIEANKALFDFENVSGE